MKKFFKFAAAAVFLTIVTPCIANDIYINQIGDSLDLDITQDGQDNQIGDSVADMTLEGDAMTFSITQTGSYNDIEATIKGDTYTGTWSFTGDTNTVDLLCSSASAANCESVTLNIATTGDDNDYTFRIGETSDAQSSTIAFTVTGDDNIINSTVDGKSASLTVNIDNSASLATTSTAGDAGVAVTTSQSGDGDSAGHSITLDVTGGGGEIDVIQSGIYDNTVDLTISGDSFDVDITQTD